MNKKSKTNFYLCTVAASLSHLLSNSVRHSDIAHAEQGKYVIKFHVKDKAGNSECSTLHRTVIVVDTLPPVISLKFEDQLLHVSGHSQIGIGGQKNPAGTANGNPYIDQNIGLMKIGEQHIGWTCAAVVSAIVGVALLAKRSPSKSVPV